MCWSFPNNLSPRWHNMTICSPCSPQRTKRDLKLNPLSALFRGDMRYADRLGDYLTDAYNDAGPERMRGPIWLRLHGIDREALTQTDRIAYDVFRYNQDQTLSRPDAGAAAPSLRCARSTISAGFTHSTPPSPAGRAQPRSRPSTDYDNNLKRHDDYIAINDRAIGRFREGMKSGVLETSLTIRNVIEQLDTQLAMPIEESHLLGSDRHVPGRFQRRRQDPADGGNIARRRKAFTTPMPACAISCAMNICPPHAPPPA